MRCVQVRLRMQGSRGFITGRAIQNQAGSLWVRACLIMRNRIIVPRSMMESERMNLERCCARFLQENVTRKGARVSVEKSDSAPQCRFLRLREPCFGLIVRYENAVD